MKRFSPKPSEATALSSSVPLFVSFPASTLLLVRSKQTSDSIVYLLVSVSFTQNKSHTFQASRSFLLFFTFQKPELHQSTKQTIVTLFILYIHQNLNPSSFQIVSFWLIFKTTSCHTSDARPSLLVHDHKSRNVRGSTENIFSF